MPFVQITLIEGRDAAAVSECARAVHNSLAAPLESIRVTINEVPATHWIVGDRTRAEISASAVTANDAANKAAQRTS